MYENKNYLIRNFVFISIIQILQKCLNKKICLDKELIKKKYYG